MEILHLEASPLRELAGSRGAEKITELAINKPDKTSAVKTIWPFASILIRIADELTGRIEDNLSTVEGKSIRKRIDRDRGRNIEDKFAILTILRNIGLLSQK